MPYVNPFTRDGREHVVRVIDNVITAQHLPNGGTTTVGQSVYKLKVVCSCQWEVLCRDEAEAAQWKQAHEMRHLAR